MFTTKDGYTYLLFPYVDSIRLGSMFVYDTSIHNNGIGNYYIAVYDPLGNVISLHARKAYQSGFFSIVEYFNNRMFAIGYSPTGDTVNGHPIAVGMSLFILDSTGNVLKVKHVGSGGFVPNAASTAISNKSVYLNIRPLALNTIHNCVKVVD